MQAILKQNCSGTILTAINKNEFLNIPVPLINDEIQKQIKIKLNESFELREKSKNLLEIAIGSVEMAIEEDEKTAEQYMRDECSKLDVSIDED